MSPSVSDRAAVVQALEGAASVALATHVNPDGDALGSLLGMSAALAGLGKQTFPLLASSEATVPAQYLFLPGVEDLLTPGSVPAADVFVAVDCGDLERLGDLAEAFGDHPLTINIDHHPGNPGFADLNLVATEASSTAEIVVHLLRGLGARIDLAVATCLYTGIVTDTGRFQYTNTSPDTLRLAADLLETGVPAHRIAEEVFESSPFDYLKLLGRVLERATLFEDVRFVYSWVVQRDLAETGIALDETEKLVDLVRGTRAADVAAMFKEQDDGRWRVSLRSKGPSVGAIARAHGGGGHELAAGFTADDRERAVADIRSALAG